MCVVVLESRGAVGGLPFEIYDESEDQHKALPKPVAAPFTVFQDENDRFVFQKLSWKSFVFKVYVKKLSW